MSEEALKKFKKDYFLLLEAGFLAVNDADEDSAIKLFRAAQLLEPKATFPRVGFGYMHFCKLEIAQATDVFNEVLEKEPDNEVAKTLLGLCLSMNPSSTSKGEKLLESTEKSSHDTGVKKLAHTALDFVEKFVKKAPSPAEVQKPKRSPKGHK